MNVPQTRADDVASALFAHPGHELLVCTTLSDLSATVSFMSDGSGGQGEDRSAYSIELIADCGCRLGPVAGHAPDRAFYDAIMAGDASFFSGIVEAVIEDLIATGTTVLITDPMEYFNPLHDLANTIADIAIVRVGRYGRNIVKFVYPNEYPELFDPAAAALRRDLCAEDRDLVDERGERYLPLRAEKQRFQETGKLAGRSCELLFADPVRLADVPLPSETIFKRAFYEEYGSQAVAAGRYSRHLTFQDHVLPLTRELVAREAGELAVSQSTGIGL
ncbi:MAG: hypothetical protein WAU86_08760 [Oricola sp.]